MKAIKDFFLRAGIWICLNGRITLVLFCALLLLISVLVLKLVFFTFFSVFLEVILIFIAMAIIFSLIFKKKEMFSERKNKKTMPAQDKKINQPDKIPVNHGPSCKTCGVNTGLLSPENCIKCDGGNDPAPDEGEAN